MSLKNIQSNTDRVSAVSAIIHDPKNTHVVRCKVNNVFGNCERCVDARTASSNGINSATNECTGAKFRYDRLKIQSWDFKLGCYSFIFIFYCCIFMLM